MLRISTILLAAGLSRRMGPENKLLLPVRGKPMITHMIDNLMGSKISELLVVIGHQSEIIQSQIDAPDLKFVHNQNYHTGMTSSIKAGVDALSPDTDAFMICLSDMPLLRQKNYDELIDFYQNNNHDKALMVRPEVNNTKGHPVIFNINYKKSILACKDLDGCSSVIKSHKSNLKIMKSDDLAFIKDIDTPNDQVRLSL